MPALRKRLGASIFLTVLSLVTIVLLLPTSRVSTQLQKIGLPNSIDHYWNWGDEEEEEEDVGGIRFVVFGDSWVDYTGENGKSGKGRSYVEVLCDEINCTSCFNFASSQPGTEYPARPPTGVMTSNFIHESAMEQQSIPANSSPEVALPDLTSQIHSFMDLPMPKMPMDAIFVFSFGFWDIYDFARLDYELAKKVVDSSIAVIFSELNILYDHSVDTYLALKADNPTNSTEVSESPPTFQVIFPKLFDPTLLPGWVSQRPLPLSPDNFAEQQKAAVYLTARWNSLMENRMTAWVNDVAPKEDVEKKEDEKKGQDPKKAITPEDESNPGVREQEKEELGIVYKPPPTPTPTPTPIYEPASPSPSPNPKPSHDSSKNIIAKDIIYYDLPGLLLDLIIEHQFEDDGISDASGIGKGESPFMRVDQPCVREAETGDMDGLVDLNGMLVCKEPDEYLWWDSWNLGRIAKEMIGKELAEMVEEGKTLKTAWEKAKLKQEGGH